MPVCGGGKSCLVRPRPEKIIESDLHGPFLVVFKGSSDAVKSVKAASYD